jgi:hypothetical protein
MNIGRKIQLTAAAVITNGALALGVLSPTAAFGVTCPPPQYGCEGNQAQCSYEFNFCKSLVPPGCKLSNFTCIVGQAPCGELVKATCFFAPI